MPKQKPGLGDWGRKRVREDLAAVKREQRRGGATKPGLGAAGRQRIKDSLAQFALADDATREALFNVEENFDPWTAATPGYDNARKEMLGERTNGQDSTRLSYCQYFFNPNTLVGDMYVDFRGRAGRRNGNRYMYTNVPVYAAKRFYTALSKGKSINRALNGLEQFGYMPYNDEKHFSKPPATDLGLKIQKGSFGNVANTVERATEFKPRQQSNEGPAQPRLFD